MNRSVEDDTTYELTDRYELIRQVGSGLLGVVFEVLDRTTGQPVAAKLLTHAVARDKERFRREYEALSRLDHPHLARYVELLERDGSQYMIGEFVNGVDLLAYLAKPPTPEELRALEVREESADEGLSDSDDAPPSGPIELDPEFAPATGEILTDQYTDEHEETDQSEAPTKEVADEQAVEPASGEHAAGAPEESPDGVDDRADDDQTGVSGSHDDGSADAESTGADTASGERTRDAVTSETVELIDVVDTSPSQADRDSAAEIIAELAAEGSQPLDIGLDLVLLRLERVLPQVVDALEHLHRFRKQHGDLKPQNILVDPGGRVVLTDYAVIQELDLLTDDLVEDASGEDEPEAGEAGEDESEANELDADERAEDEPNEDSTSEDDELSETPLTDAPMKPASEQELCQTYACRAPETLGLDEASPEADLYALGCVLFEAISGQKPFGGEPQEIREKQLEAEPRSLSELEPQCPASWADVIHGLLDKNPKRRPGLADVRELVEYSESYAVDIPPSAVPEQEFFFGRSELVDDVLTEIKRSYQRKRLGVSMLCGPAGVGKTAISQAVSYLASRRGWLVLTGKCYNRESLIYQGWDEIAAQLADIFCELPEDLQQKADACRRQAATLFPVLRFDDDPPVRDLDRLDAIDSFRSLLRRLSSQRPLLLLMDDLHWASWDTSALLLDLIGEPSGIRCMVLGTWLGDSEPEGGHPLIEGLESAPGPLKWFDVSGFSKDEAREYVISAGSHLSLQDQRRVLRTGEFNPLLLEELIHDMQPDGATAEEIEKFVAGHQADGSPVTDKLTEVLEKRIEALNRRERFVLEVLSVASIPLAGAIISTILDEEFHSSQSVENTARDAINSLVEARFIQPVESHHWEIAYTVAHNIYRRHLLDELRDQRYAHLCRRIAEGLRRCWPAAEELRFEYLLRGGLDREAADSAIRAARMSESRFAYNRAAKLWRWLSDHAGHTSLSPDLLPRAEHARMEFLAHRFTESAELYHQVVRETEVDLTRARFLCREFEASLHAARHTQAREALERALMLVGESFNHNGLLSRLGEVKDRALAATSRWTDKLEEARVESLDETLALRAELYRLALDAGDLLEFDGVCRIRTRLSVLAEKTADACLLGLDRLYLAQDAAADGGWKRPQRIDNWLSEAASLFEQSADWELRGLTEIAGSNHRRRMGQFDAAEQRLAMATKYFRSAGKRQLRHRYQLKLTHAQILLDQAHLDEAEHLGRQLLHFARGDLYVTYRAYKVLIECFLQQGRTGLAEQLLEHCHRLLHDIPISMARVWLARVEARLNIALGRPEVAAGQLDVLADQMHRSRLMSDPGAQIMHQLSLGQALAALAEREQVLIQHRPTETLQRLKEVMRALQGKLGNVPVRTHAEIRRLQARWELLRGNPKKALRILDQAVERLVEFDNPIEHAQCLEARGFIHRRLELSDAPNLIDLAHAVYAHYGARLPLFLEGWPVPSEHSRLCKDEE